MFGLVIYSQMCCRYLADAPYNAHHQRLLHNRNNSDVDDDDDDDMGSVQFSRSSISFSVSTTANGTNKYTTQGGTQDYTAINSTILFENSELSDDSNMGQDVIPYVTKPGWQMIFAILCTGGISAAYYWTQWLTWQWKRRSDTDSNDNNQGVWSEISYILLLYPSFWIVIKSIKFITTRFARFADSNKTSVYSLELISAFFCTCFYYVFYRNLFLHISSYEYFILVKVLHIFLELMSYPLRMSKWYFHKTEKWQNQIKDSKSCWLTCFQPIIWVLYDPSAYHIWCVRICIDYTLTLIVSMGSAISYIVGVLWLKYGYNQYFYDIQDIEMKQFERALIFTAIGICVELIVYYIIEKLMKYQYQIDVIKHWRVLIQHRPGYIWYFIFMLQHVQTDVMIAKLINV